MNLKLIFQTLLFIMLCNFSFAQNKIPLKIENKTAFADDDIYIAIVGKNQEIKGQFVYLDIKAGIQRPMDRSLNTSPGPIGDDYSQGPDGNNRYADIFIKLSEISNKTISMGAIESSRIFLSFKKPLYLFFHCSGPENCIDSNGNIVGPGYTSPDHNNPFDPNRDIVYEIIELNIANINGNLEFHGNTSRVDSFQHPLGLEIIGSRGTQMVGEIASKDEIVNAFRFGAPIEFIGCIDNETGVITAPSKTPEFKEGKGQYANYFQPYIDRVWEKYKSYRLSFRDGDGILWEGGIQGEKLIVIGNAPGSIFDGKKAVVERRPNTQEVLEGKGVFNSGNGFDKRIQAQFCAAFNRHIINDQPGVDPGVQDWGDSSAYYKVFPYNYYASFWHDERFVLNEKGYGFAYDDVFDQSTLLYEPNTQAIKIVLGPITNTNPPSFFTTIPGILEAEDYKPSGPGVGYNDSSLGNSGGAYKQNDVDIENTGDTNGRYNVGWIDSGEWLAYDISATEASNTYDIGFRVASPNGNGSFHLEMNGTPITEIISIPNTGNWQHYKTVTIKNVSIGIGNHEVRIVFDSPELNINFMEFKKATNTPGGGAFCSGVAANGQYSYEISSDVINPTITFKPEVTGTGDTVCILYYGTSATGSYPGYIVSPNEAYQINASKGETIYFYYTYSLPTGGENNTANSRHNFVTGQCNASQASKSKNDLKENVMVFPNPVLDKVQIQLSTTHNFNNLEIVDIHGKIILKQKINPKELNINLDIRNHEKGLFFLNLYGNSKKQSIKLMKE